MTVFLGSSLLREAGFDHGFGTRRTKPDEYPKDMLILKQVHGERIIILQREGGRKKEEAEGPELVEGGEGRRTTITLDIRFRDLPENPFRFEEGDALITDIPATAIGIRTADCLPVLIGDTASGAAAAVHCGWRSLSLGLAGKTALALLEGRGSGAADLVAALGPSIGRCCYEVGKEVRDRFRETGCCDKAFEDSARGLFLDLKAATRIQLESAGLSADAIDVVGGCTSCEEENYWSWRARKEKERMVSWIRAEKTGGTKCTARRLDDWTTKRPDEGMT